MSHALIVGTQKSGLTGHMINVCGDDDQATDLHAYAPYPLFYGFQSCFKEHFDIYFNTPKTTKAFNEQYVVAVYLVVLMVRS